MKKRVLIMMFATAMTVTGITGTVLHNPAQVRAEDTDEEGSIHSEGDYVYSLNGNEAVIESYRGTEEEVIIPAELGGQPVTKISVQAFYQRESIRKLTIPDTVTSIGWEAFTLCSNLEEIILSKNISYIGETAFYGTGIKSIEIPESYQSSYFDSGNDIFSYCPNLETVVYHAEKFHIGDFSGCPNLKTVQLGKNTKTVISFAAYGTQPVIKVPADSPYLKSVDGVIYTKDGTELQYYPLYKTEASYTVLSGTKQINAGVFEENTVLASIALPDTLEVIKEWAFYKCSLKSLNLPPSVKMVEDQNFNYTASLKTVTVGGKNTQFGKASFDRKVTTAVCARDSKAAKYFLRKNTNAKQIIYTLNGGVNHANNVYYFSKTRTLNTPSRKGYKFAGWYTNKACTKKITKVSRGKNYHVYAKWVKE